MADIYIGNIKGPQGVQGETGEQGVPGEAATIEVGTVSTTAYGNTAQVINSGTSSEAVFDFVIPQGRPGEETTTMSSLTLDTVTAQSAEYPIPATGESGAVVFGKIIKFFNDIKTAVNSKINISDIVNNLTSTATNKPLSAAQGKALNDALSNSITWKEIGTANVSQSISVPNFSSYKEVMVIAVYSDGTNTTKWAMPYPVPELQKANGRLEIGSYQNATYYSRFVVGYTTAGSFHFAASAVNGNTGQGFIRVWAR